MDNATQWNAAVRRLSELIQDIEVAMLTTVDTTGFLHSRPMASQNKDFDGILWFFTKQDSPKVHELSSDERVNVSFASPKDQRYVSVAGTATVLRDPAKARGLWSPVVRAWFPDGPEDLSLRLIRVSVDYAEYWDSPTGKMRAIAGFVKAVATGEAVENGQLGENKKFDLTG